MQQTLEPSRLQEWEGRSELVFESLDLAHVKEVAATLNSHLSISDGSPLPHLWHWAFFRPKALTVELGPDGHPPKGGFLPPVALPRRMWAGGRLQLLRPLTVGCLVSRSSTIKTVEAKSGRSGNLVFVTVQHDYSCNDEMCVVEEQDIVYREAAQSSGQKVPVHPEEARSVALRWKDDFATSPVLLFRYSAVTFNSHRIHYDQGYASTEEGYRGLVVHGPLAATLMLTAYCRREGGEAVKGFSFRGVAPLIEEGRLSVCCERVEDKSATLYVSDASGRKTMEGSVSLI
ncbi:MaoC family dehydratase N-terminal domain-containing protein [Paraburkholderia sp. 22B1P]|uniref:FAS1-like dehydratase domain-containing protein n=1 Tax=Paraburkholderia sp. 22B1P TaxID=3080498 RepID=UPI0030924DBB|nr:MaoC family dehydratase N-terminal domain-containing protein [Paraburkholderia sp. 22B1P]